MSNEVWSRFKPSIGEYVKVVYFFRGLKFTEERLKVSKFTNDSVILLTENWANDFFDIKIKDILFIQKRLV